MLRPIFIHGLDQTHLKTGSGHSEILDLNYVIRNAKQIKLSFQISNFFGGTVYTTTNRRLVLFLIPSAMTNTGAIFDPISFTDQQQEVLLKTTCGYLWILISDKNCF